jgi:hypothetical protein
MSLRCSEGKRSNLTAQGRAALWPELLSNSNVNVVKCPHGELVLRRKTAKLSACWCLPRRRSAKPLLLEVVAVSTMGRFPWENAFGFHLANASDDKSRVTLVYDQVLPNVLGKSIRGVLVEYEPGGLSPAHTHPNSAFITVLEGRSKARSTRASRYRPLEQR